MSTTSVSTSTSGGSPSVSGLASGFNWQQIVSELVTVDEAPEQQLQSQQTTITNQKNAISTIQSALTTLQTSAAQLANASFFSSRTADVSDTTLATATAASGTGVGTYSLDVTHLATSAVWNGTTGVTAPLSPTDDVSNLDVTTAPFATPVTAGTFTVNGQQITISADETLGSVFTAINNATGGAVTASYSSASDEITLSSSSTIVLGSATDTSNFLQAAQLGNNGTGTVTSATKLGSVNLTGPLDQSNLATAVSDGGSGNGAFKINGVTINFNATNDSIDNIISRINQSGAGVTAAYDANTGQFTLTDQSTGDVGISVQDITGNFLAATGLAGGSLQRGQNLAYTVNNGPQLTSQSNTITPASSGITGLTVTALKPGTFNVTVGADTGTIATAITNFVNQYNQIQTAIDNQIAPITDASGNVTPGLLEDDNVITALNTNLRQMMNGAVSGLSGTITQLANLGFQSNGQNDAISTSDTTDLDNALASNLAGVGALFSNASTGLAVQMNNYLTDALGSSGALATDVTGYTNQYNDLTKQINQIQAQANSDQTKYTNEFVAMETADSTMNSQLSYLNSLFGGSSSSSSSSSSG